MSDALNRFFLDQDKDLVDWNMVFHRAYYGTDALEITHDEIQVDTTVFATDPEHHEARANVGRVNPMMEVGTPPCEMRGGCENREYCGRNAQDCRAYREYVSGRVSRHLPWGVFITDEMVETLLLAIRGTDLKTLREYRSNEL